MSMVRIFRRWTYRVSTWVLTLLPIPRKVNAALRWSTQIIAGEQCADMRVNGEARVLRKFAPSCTVLFDVGANVGAWTDLALAHAAPAAELHCFEPMKELCDRLVSKGYPERVHLVHSGLSDGTEQSAELFSSGQSLYQKAWLGRECEGEPSEVVPLTTIDRYCMEQGITRIDFLKIDAEGHDLHILKGAETMLQNEAVLRIQFEYGPFNVFSRVLLRDFYRFFEDRPYRMFLIKRFRLVPVDRMDLQYENFLLKNFLVLHRSVADV